MAFGGEAEHTLNYNIRILGRRGVLILNAVADMKQLPSIRKETRGVLSAVEFEEGHRYQDYLPGEGQDGCLRYHRADRGRHRRESRVL